MTPTRLDDPSIPVLRGQSIRSWPAHAEGGWARPTSLSTALTRRYTFDAHLAAYAAPANQRRLSWGALDPAHLEQIGGGVEMVIAAFDVDHADAHKGGGSGSGIAREAWWAEQRERIAALAGAQPAPFVYASRGGYRIVYRLAAPFLLTCREDGARWTTFYLESVAYLRRAFGIVADPTADWQRLFRLPHATREDGQAPEEHPTIGNPRRIGVWTPEITDVDRSVAVGLRRRPASSGQRPRVRSTSYAGPGLLANLFGARGWVGEAVDSTRTTARCPRADEHSGGRSGLEGSAVLYAPDRGAELGWFHCSHTGHGHDRWSTREVLGFFSDAEIKAARRAAGIPEWDAPPLDLLGLPADRSIPIALLDDEEQASAYRALARAAGQAVATVALEGRWAPAWAERLRGREVRVAVLDEQHAWTALRSLSRAGLSPSRARPRGATSWSAIANARRQVA